jgi:starvation-inducible DNA-binding protein
LSEPTPVTRGLNGLLADATVFYQKLRHYHWNVAGTDFFVLHEKFETLYDGWATGIDDIAERILMLNDTPLHTLAAMLETTQLAEDSTIPSAPEMVDAVVADLQQLRTRITAVIKQAEAAGDRGTVNLLDGLLDGIEKDAWMLRAWRQETAGTWS